MVLNGLLEVAHSKGADAAEAIANTAVEAEQASTAGAGAPKGKLKDRFLSAAEKFKV